MLPREAIEEFKKLYLEVYGVQLSDTEASLRANNLVNFYMLVYGDREYGLVKNKNQENKVKDEAPENGSMELQEKINK